MTTVDKALAALAQRTQPTLTPGQTAAEALSGLPLVKKRKRSEPRPPVMREPTDPSAHLCTPPWEAPSPEDTSIARKVLEHDNTGAARLTLRDLDTGEFASVEQARRHPEEVTTDFVENRTPAKKTPSKRAVKKTSTKKATSKKVAKKVPAKKIAKRSIAKETGGKSGKK